VFAAVASGADLICARFGGEEFTLAVRDAGELEAARLARGLVQAIESLAIAHPGRADGVGVVTVSVGVAFKPHGTAVSWRDVFADADRALYQAKRRGRNCFVLDHRVAEQRARST
jgi:diguanylate cyclase (GGDEF)-like protein